MYSNILYVKEQFAALSHLAHRVASADKYRPETCCIIGNYYSLKGQHEKVGRLARTLCHWHMKGLPADARHCKGVFCTAHKGDLVQMSLSKVHARGGMGYKQVIPPTDFLRAGLYLSHCI